MLLADPLLDEQYTKLKAQIVKQSSSGDNTDIISRLNTLLITLNMYRQVAFRKIHDSEIKTSLSVHLIDLFQSLVPLNESFHTVSDTLKHINNDILFSFNDIIKADEQYQSGYAIKKLMKNIMFNWCKYVNWCLNGDVQQYTSLTEEDNVLLKLLKKRGGMFSFMTGIDRLSYIQFIDVMISVCGEAFRHYEEYADEDYAFMLSVFVYGLFSCIGSCATEFNGRTFVFIEDEMEEYKINWYDAFDVKRKMKDFTFPTQELVYSLGASWFTKPYRQYKWSKRVSDLMVDDVCNYNPDLMLDLFKQLHSGLYNLAVDKKEFEQLASVMLSDDNEKIEQVCEAKYVSPDVMRPFADALRLALLKEWFLVNSDYGKDAKPTFQDEYILSPHFVFKTQDGTKINYQTKMTTYCSGLPNKISRPSTAFIIELSPNIWGVADKKTVYIAKSFDYAVRKWFKLVYESYSSRVYILSSKAWITLFDKKDLVRFESVKKEAPVAKDETAVVQKEEPPPPVVDRNIALDLLARMRQKKNIDYDEGRQL
jgi:hypothetical protein